MDCRRLGLGRRKPILKLCEGGWREVSEREGGGRVLLNQGIVRLEYIASVSVGGGGHSSAGVGGRAFARKLRQGAEEAKRAEHGLARRGLL